MKRQKDRNDMDMAPGYGRQCSVKIHWKNMRRRQGAVDIGETGSQAAKISDTPPPPYTVK